jgi:NADH:ubiquinone oxidoreductase subunit 5 (subunit L)/multisubunit Na+/H+ antiporter MnhA subunit
VTAADFMQLFFGWEGVGLASYLLIGFWHHKPSANAAAIKAFVVNRVGDFGFALGIMTVFWMFGSIQFAEVFSNIDGQSPVRTGVHRLRLVGASTWPAGCCSSAPWASRPSSSCTPGCPTPWKARRPSRP